MNFWITTEKHMQKIEVKDLLKINNKIIMLLIIETE